MVGSSSQSTSASQADESGDSPRFAETIAGMEPGGSSSETRAPYSLDSKSPIVEISEYSFDKGLKKFLGADIRHIASNPQEYSDFVSEKAEHAATVTGSYINTYHDPARPARFYSYPLDGETVGLLRVGGPVRIKGEAFREQFGRNDLTSVVDLRVTHPLVENAGDILLEHQLRKDGDYPLILSKPARDGMEPRLEKMGFEHVGRNHWVLDPHQHPEVWTKNENDEWQRVGKPTKYLVTAEGGDTAPGPAVETDFSDEDDPSFYLERALAGQRIE
ncbi:host specificity protein [Bradyrhizobium sp. CCBAU 25338]|nr:host specificity protein [Bradyrhizobium sp. CCBAU 45389]MDA9527394.1 host specificity protein [Bradyrhizobium sp. CCBAU 25338]RXH36996.1 host specificity protein [Bradyrhizobium nanningense]